VATSSAVMAPSFMRRLWRTSESGISGAACRC
jgi:hypothetical protein